MANGSGNQVEVTLTAGDCVDAMKEIGKKVRDLEHSFKKIDQDKVLATWMSNPGSKGETAQVMYQCGDNLGGDDKDVTYGDFCAALKAVREWLQFIEQKICAQDANEVLISKR